MKSYPRFVAALAAIAIAIPVAHADPVVPVGYYVENYASGIGSASVLAIGPDGLVYVNDYASGQLLRRTASGTLEVVASGMPNATGIAFSPTGRVFVAGGDTKCLRDCRWRRDHLRQRLFLCQLPRDQGQ